MKEKWFLINEKDEKEYIDKLMKDINIDYYTAKLLVNRGIKDTTEAYDFLHPSMNEFHDGFLMKDMDKAVDIISSAIINATIIVERDSLKSIIIGKQGAMLKEIGSKARCDIENMIGKKVFLELYVKTIKNWRDKEKYLRELGFYDIDE